MRCPIHTYVRRSICDVLSVSLTHILPDIPYNTTHDAHQIEAYARPSGCWKIQKLAIRTTRDTRWLYTMAAATLLQEMHLPCLCIMDGPLPGHGGCSHTITTTATHGKLSSVFKATRRFNSGVSKANHSNIGVANIGSESGPGSWGYGSWAHRWVLL